jgi:DNA-binding response OmpR family regulator
MNLFGKVLVIDDNPDVCALLMEILTPAGYSVETAANGYEGYIKFCHMEFKAVITDLWMPVMDGMSVVVAIRRKSKHVPIILITGLEKKEQFIEAVEMEGADFVIRKPFEKATLLNAVTTLLNRDSPLQSSLNLA